MPTFKMTGSTPSIDLTGMVGGDSYRVVAKLPSGDFRVFKVQVVDMTPAEVLSRQSEHEDSATKATDRATTLARHAADDQSILDLVGKGDFIER
jgi:hypothetical protein